MFVSNSNRFQINELIIRLFNRIFIGKFRFVLIFILFGLVFISLIKLLRPSKNDIFMANDFDDHISGSREDLQYSIMIDAGSSGSRVHIYVWPPHSGLISQHNVHALIIIYFFSINHL